MKPFKPTEWFGLTLPIRFTFSSWLSAVWVCLEKRQGRFIDAHSCSICKNVLCYPSLHSKHFPVREALLEEKLCSMYGSFLLPAAETKLPVDFLYVTPGNTFDWLPCHLPSHLHLCLYLASWGVVPLIFIWLAAGEDLSWLEVPPGRAFYWLASNLVERQMPAYF